MFWIDTVKPPTAMAVLIAAMLAVPASAATLVVRSSGPSAKAYPAGRQLADNSRISLQAGDQVVILDSRGTRTLKGPGTFSPNVATNRPSDSRETFAEVSSRRARPGATRAVPKPTEAAAEPDRSPNIWFVDVERSGTVCIADTDAVTLWRPAGTAAAATLTNVADGSSEKIEWAAGQSRKAWPASLPVRDGASYRIAWDGMNLQGELRFALLDPVPAGLEDMASRLITKGCKAQLDLLIETVAMPEAAARPKG